MTFSGPERPRDNADDQRDQSTPYRVLQNVSVAACGILAVACLWVSFPHGQPTTQSIKVPPTATPSPSLPVVERWPVQTFSVQTCTQRDLGNGRVIQFCD